MMYVYTFVITGGSEFRLALPNNPVLDHNGHKTVWKVVTDAKHALALFHAFRAFEASVTYHTEKETPAMQAERANPLEANGPSNPLPDPQSH